jgi:hypothetical protein
MSNVKKYIVEIPEEAVDLIKETEERDSGHRDWYDFKDTLQELIQTHLLQEVGEELADEVKVTEQRTNNNVFKTLHSPQRWKRTTR